MKEVLYTKFNSTRKPAYRVSTSIVLEDGKKYVIKKAMQPDAKEYLQSIPENKEKLEALYANIQVIPCEYKEESGELVFPFISGKSLLAEIDFANDTFEAVVEKVKGILDVVHTYNDAYVCEFQMSEEFKSFFGELTVGNEKATTIANIDGILSNFVKTEDGKITAIDYEWVFDFPVPVRFITYRSLLYLYTDYQAALEKHTDLERFLKAFDFSEEDVALFSKMEEAFQSKVHGENRKYIYVNQYKKDSKPLARMEEELRLTRNHADNLQRIIDTTPSLYLWAKKAAKKLLKR